MTIGRAELFFIFQAINTQVDDVLDCLGNGNWLGTERPTWQWPWQWKGGVPSCRAGAAGEPRQGLFHIAFTRPGLSIAVPDEMVFHS